MLTTVCGVALGVTFALAADQAPEFTERDPMVATRMAYDAAVDSSDEGVSELAVVRRDLARAYERLGEENRLLLSRQVEIERSDPIAKRILDELLAAEKEVRLLRSRLKSRLGAIDEFQALEVKRRKLVSKVEDLRRRERDLKVKLTESVSEEGSE